MLERCDHEHHKYSHGDSTWPHSRRAIAESPLPALGAEALRRIVCDNAAELYGIA